MNKRSNKLNKWQFPILNTIVCTCSWVISSKISKPLLNIMKKPEDMAIRRARLSQR